MRGTATFVSINPAGIGTACLNSASDAMESMRKRLAPSSVHCWSGSVGQRISFRDGIRTRLTKGCQSPLSPSEAKRTECRRSKLLERLQDRQYAASILENQIAITNAQQNVKRTIASSNLNLFGSGKSIRNLGFQRERQPSILWQIVLVFEVNRRGDWALNALANQSDLRPGCFDGCGHLQNTAIFEANRSH